MRRLFQSRSAELLSEEIAGLPARPLVILSHLIADEEVELHKGGGRPEV
jgi:hypothetical protein